MRRYRFGRLKIAAVLLSALILPCTSYAKASHTGGRTVDTVKFDIAGLHLGMSGDQILDILIARFKPGWNDLYCNGCTINYSDTITPEKHSIECDADNSKFAVADEPYIMLTMQQKVRIWVRFYHANGRNTGPCIAHNILYAEAGFIPERDRAPFRAKVLAKYGPPSYTREHSWSGYDDFFWCQKIDRSMGPDECDRDQSSLSATIDDNVLGTAATVMTLSDPRGRNGAIKRRELEDTPAPAMRF